MIYTRIMAGSVAESIRSQSMLDDDEKDDTKDNPPQSVPDRDETLPDMDALIKSLDRDGYEER